MKKYLLASVAILAGSAATAEDIVIRMAAPDWGPTRFMQDYANETYTAPSGNNVTLLSDRSAATDRISLSFADKSPLINGLEEMATSSANIRRAASA